MTLGYCRKNKKQKQKQQKKTTKIAQSTAHQFPQQKNTQGTCAVEKSNTIFGKGLTRVGMSMADIAIFFFFRIMKIKSLL